MNPSRPSSDTARDSAGARPQDAPKASPDGDPAMQGEGNRTAARRYNEETTDFVQSGRVDEAARNARPANAEEAREMEDAEAEGRSRAREEDPALKRGSSGSERTSGNPSADKSR